MGTVTTRTPADEIELIVDDTARRYRRARLVDALLILASALVLVSHAGALVAYQEGEGGIALIGSALLSAMALLYGLVTGLVAPRLRAKDRRSMAALIEEAYPELDPDLSTSIELVREPDGPTFSRGLMWAHTERVLERLATLDLLAPFRSTIRSQLLIGLALVTLSAVGGWIMQPEALGTGFSLMGGLGPAPPPVMTSDAPQELDVVEAISFELLPPPYTGKGMTTLDNTSGDVTVLQGTEVTMHLTTMGSYPRAVLIPTAPPGPPLPLEHVGTTHHTITLTIDTPLAFVFEFEGLDGARYVDGRPRTITVSEDDPPKASLLMSLDSQTIMPEEVLSLGFQLSDDYGLSSLDLAYSFPESSGTIFRKKLVELHGKTYFLGLQSIDMATLEAQPGDVVTLWLEAYDTDTVSGPKRGTSNKLTLKIFSPEDKHDENIETLQGFFETLLGLLADRLVLSASTFEGSRATFQGLMEPMSAFLLESESDPFIAEEAIEEIRGIQDRIAALFAKETKLVDGLGPDPADPPSEASEITKHNGAIVTELEKDVLKLEHLLDLQRKKKILRQTSELIDLQGNLIAILDGLSAQPNELLLTKLQAELDNIERRAGSLAKGAASLVKVLPGAHMNASSGAPLPMMMQPDSIREKLDQIRALTAKGEFELAKTIAEELQSALQGEFAELEEDYQASVAQLDKGGMQTFDKVMKRVASALATQKEILDATEKVAEVYVVELDAYLAGEVEELVAHELDALQKVQTTLAGIPGDDLHPSDALALGKLGKDLEYIREILGGKDLTLTASLLSKLTDAIDDLHYEIKKYGEYIKDAKKKTRLTKATKALRKASKALQKSIMAIEQATPTPSEFLSKKLIDKLSALSMAQADNLETMVKAHDALQKLANQFTSFPAQPSRLSKSIKGAMGKSVDALEAVKPAKSTARQKMVIDNLEKLQTVLQGIVKPKKGGASFFHGLVEEDVKLPTAQSYKPPDSLKKALMEAMGEKLPPAYADPIKHYFETILKE